MNNDQKSIYGVGLPAEALIAQKLPKGVDKPDEEQIRLSEQVDFVGFCWSCTVADWELQNGDAKAACLAKGHLQNCSRGNNGCYSVIRKRGGIMTSLEMGCTQMKSCENEENSNFAGPPNRCRPDGVNPRKESHCSSCCDPKTETNCNLKFMDETKWDPSRNDYETLA